MWCDIVVPQETHAYERKVLEEQIEEVLAHARVKFSPRCLDMQSSHERLLKLHRYDEAKEVMRRLHILVCRRFFSHHKHPCSRRPPRVMWWVRRSVARRPPSRRACPGTWTAAAEDRASTTTIEEAVTRDVEQKLGGAVARETDAEGWPTDLADNETTTGPGGRTTSGFQTH